MWSLYKSLPVNFSRPRLTPGNGAPRFKASSVRLPRKRRVLSTCWVSVVPKAFWTGTSKTDSRSEITSGWTGAPLEMMIFKWGINSRFNSGKLRIISSINRNVAGPPVMCSGFILIRKYLTDSGFSVKNSVLIKQIGLPLHRALRKDRMPMVWVNKGVNPRPAKRFFSKNPADCQEAQLLIKAPWL